MQNREKLKMEMIWLARPILEEMREELSFDGYLSWREAYADFVRRGDLMPSFDNELAIEILYDMEKVLDATENKV